MEITATISRLDSECSVSVCSRYLATSRPSTLGLVKDMNLIHTLLTSFEYIPPCESVGYCPNHHCRMRCRCDIRVARRQCWLRDLSRCRDAISARAATLLRHIVVHPDAVNTPRFFPLVLSCRLIRSNCSTMATILFSSRVSVCVVGGGLVVSSAVDIELYSSMGPPPILAFNMCSSSLDN